MSYLNSSLHYRRIYPKSFLNLWSDNELKYFIYKYLYDSSTDTNAYALIET